MLFPLNTPPTTFNEINYSTIFYCRHNVKWNKSKYCEIKTWNGFHTINWKQTDTINFVECNISIFTAGESFKLFNVKNKTKTRECRQMIHTSLHIPFIYILNDSLMILCFWQAKSSKRKRRRNLNWVIVIFAMLLCT